MMTFHRENFLEGNEQDIPEYSVEHEIIQAEGELAEHAKELGGHIDDIIASLRKKEVAPEFAERIKSVVRDIDEKMRTKIFAVQTAEIAATVTALFTNAMMTIENGPYFVGPLSDIDLENIAITGAILLVFNKLRLLWHEVQIGLKEDRIERGTSKESNE